MAWRGRVARGRASRRRATHVRSRPARVACSAALAALAVVASGCARVEPPDAYGNVEATAVVVASEVGGALVSFTVQEGQDVAAGAAVGAVDPTALELQRDQLVAQRAATASKGDEAARQVPVIEAQQAAAVAQQQAAVAQRAALGSQLEIARRALDRTTRLVAQQAATAQQLDQAERDVRVFEDQARAQDQQIEAQGRQAAAHAGQIAAVQAQRQTVAHQVSSAAAQVAQVDDRIKKSRITNPSPGTVLVTYARPGEIVQPGQPLYRIADLSVVDVRAYLTEPQLADVQIGQMVAVGFDAAGGRQRLSGTVSWIAREAEFTPTPIQTRDERADLVYAIKIRVPNDERRLKIGMPVDVELRPGR